VEGRSHLMLRSHARKDPPADERAHNEQADTVDHGPRCLHPGPHAVTVEGRSRRRGWNLARAAGWKLARGRGWKLARAAGWNRARAIPVVESGVRLAAFLTGAPTNVR
jgi:hypothetical protein